MTGQQECRRRGCETATKSRSPGCASTSRRTRSWACETHVGPHESCRPNCVAKHFKGEDEDGVCKFQGQIQEGTGWHLSQHRSRRPSCVSCERWTRSPGCEIWWQFRTPSCDTLAAQSSSHVRNPHFTSAVDCHVYNGCRRMACIKKGEALSLLRIKNSQNDLEWVQIEALREAPGEA
ncbi:hypothetical protein Fmac_018017 [Flemingia macrophylla]|uniref:Uncharacterized protein n=1 Tax=Flemingia macrophylla TaxID=520843 RepID=A0ABD1M3Y1_9FABA